MKKSTLLCLATVLCISQAFTQSNLQVYSSYVKNLNKDYKGNTFGLGFRIEFGKDDATLTKYAGFAYNAPIITHATNQAIAYSSLTDPYSIDVATVYKIPSYRAEFGGRFYFVGSAHNYDGINVFGNGGAEVIFAPNKPKYESYDKDLYNLGYTEGSDVNEDGTEKFALNLMLVFGAGIEKNIGPGNIFLHAAIALPVTTNGNSDISSRIEDFTPLPLNINLGYKIPLSRSE